ncbi:ABC transporter substrate-binding protein [Sulfitobacter geojensis]|uniref:ABC transporter substrate-binding protein n=1 Tax=Sulfitobacter geojensis TaxID=1342299 RepID=A0AAE3B7H2_9RHOB|nr:ABC transporter substrate-binding protein [Sulfitobacter geojensis]MBM1690810.1 ABC transporter substrate-binding protein [Sulfitobacter geojensis]MBM1694876.1 ABC transporter substrate-binding protein [Sulfitobacter geojensis]MBM1706970.1 ABC transporter substrate-binding protein [Sulfitobacter geojensis]MBM1711028.1 ABC transporter substrate-binding protein [Sulfitobacter geojensis]MBM1715094.1 ABC transporter substrate-binding protein [Sulfitobacter geojensis]
MRHQNFLAPIAFALGLAAAGVASAQTLTMGVRGGPESMDPHFSALGSHAEAAKHIFDTLVWSGTDLQIEPGLATSWEAIDEDTWEFKLREGVKFHDGSDFDAEDVKFSIERIPVVTGPTTTAIYVRRVASVDIIDPYTVHINTDGQAATLPNDFIRLFIVSSEAAADYSTPETAAEGFNSGKATIGTGPYKYVSWEPKADLVLERNDDYWRGEGAWEKVIRKEIPNDSSRLAALKSGQVDVINYVSSVDYLALERDSSVDAIKGDSVYVMNLQLDQREETPLVRAKDGSKLDENPFRDLKVRQAIDLAIDRETMVEVVLEGLGKPANQMMPAGFFGSSEKIPTPEYNPAKAKEMLTEAGYPDGFEVDLYCTGDRLPGDAAICQGLGQMLTQVGIKTNVNAISKTVYFPAQARLEYSMFMNGWGTLTGEASYTVGSLAHSNNPEVKLGAFNRIEYKNDEVDALMQAGATMMNPDERRAAYEEAMEKVMADKAYISLVQLQTVWGAKAGTLDFETRFDEDTLAFFIKPAS